MTRPEPLAPTWRMLSRFARSPYLSVNWHGVAVFRKGSGLMLQEQVSASPPLRDWRQMGRVWVPPHDA